ncbi:hypothetical protein Dda_6773 [Drechslerella dactyloides]|uniref:Uncharacterized protein n=1 Tax=Drechslerella dactyloides TaxID=74499 RepID=A0AAD6IUS0_DREDA|nr:hypothetical protein Dda_6773 [Drechslerella dactyloides]
MLSSSPRPAVSVNIDASMPPSSQKSALKLVKYVPVLPDETMLASSGDAQVPIVHLPAHMPPPIAMAETGYAVGIADPNGLPAWAKPISVSEGHSRRHCSHHHHHHHATIAPNAGPEYLVPMATAVPNPNGPGLILLQPADPRMVPCMSVPGAYATDSDELDTIRGENYRNRNQPLLIGSGEYSDFEADELGRDFARVRLQAEASERFRFEELERERALHGEHAQAEEAKRQRDWETWALAMGIIQDRERVGGGPGFPHHEAYEDSERVININIRQPCKMCREPVIMETQTVHHRFPNNDASKGIGINVDGPGKSAEDDVLCRRCKDDLNEKKEKKELLRKVVREVIDEKSKAKKEKKDKGGTVVLHSSSSSEFASAESDENDQPYDREHTRKTQNLSLRHRGGNKEQAFEVRLGETTVDILKTCFLEDQADGPVIYRVLNPSLLLHAATLAVTIITPITITDNTQNPSSMITVALSPRLSFKSGDRKHQAHTPVSGLSKTRYVNVVEDVSTEASSSESERDENEAPGVHRSSRAHKVTHHHGSRSHQSPLAASIKQNPDKFVKAVLRHLDGETYREKGHNPKLAVKVANDKRHIDTTGHSCSSEEGSKDSEEYDVNVNFSVKKPQRDGKHSSHARHHRGRAKAARLPEDTSTSYTSRGHHRRSSSAGDYPVNPAKLHDSLHTSAGRHSSPHIGKGGKHSVTGDRPGFLRGWSFFQKSSF